MEQDTVQEQRRLAAVTAYDILDTPREPAFDNIVFIAAQLFRVPIAKLAIIAADRIWLKASVGRLTQNTPRQHSFCSAVVEQDTLVIVEDALLDPRFAQLPIVVGEPRIRFYAGAPLRGPSNEVVGTLGVMDIYPRTVPERARLQLIQLAQEAETLLRQRGANQPQRRLANQTI